MVAAPLLVTGFGSFLDVERNPSGLVALALAADATLAAELGAEVRAAELPVSIERSAPALDALLAALAGPPAAILCLGVQREAWFRLERRARARLDSKKIDVDGRCARGIVLPGAELVETPFALAPLVAALRAAGAADARASEDAGGYVCERIYHHALARGAELGAPALFLHLPPLAAVPLEQQVPIVRALAVALHRGALGLRPAGPEHRGG